MRQKLGIFLGLAVLILILIGLNAATYVQKEKMPDNEIFPNRSTFNSGSTGTQALYTLLSETGRRATRWQQPIDALVNKSSINAPSTFVVIGKARRPFEDVEIRQLLDWVNGGGRLVIVDREIDERIAKTIAVWQFTSKTNDLELLYVTDPSDAPQMTSGMPASRPVQPSQFAVDVNAIQTSRFASHIDIGSKQEGGSINGLGTGLNMLAPQPDSTPIDFFGTSPDPSNKAEEYQAPPPPAPPSTRSTPAAYATVQGDEVLGDAAYSAPVVHIVGNNRNILVDVPYGAGQIVMLSDPFVVSNAGIGLVDNARLAVNILSKGDGFIAFDEYHQGFGGSRNPLFAYFSGTPVIPIFGQLGLIMVLAMFSRSRRFARAVPEPEPDRRTKLEYVSAMAELQQRTRAYDLAIENIFGEFKRRVAHLLGVDVRMTDRRVLASLVADRIKGDADEIDSLLAKCQDIVHGESSSNKETVAMAARIRQIEKQLGLERTETRRGQ